MKERIFSLFVSRKLISLSQKPRKPKLTIGWLVAWRRRSTVSPTDIESEQNGKTQTVGSLSSVRAVGVGAFDWDYWEGNIVFDLE
jgi:hypothetical protein